MSPDPERLTLDSNLDCDLGFDSLARVELLTRLERILNVQLPKADVLGSAEKLADLLHAMQSAVDQQAGTSWENADRRESPSRRLGHSSAGIPISAATLNEVLDWQAQRRGEVTHAILVDGLQAQSLTHRVLRDQARVAAGSLQRAGVQPGDTVALMLPTALEYFCAFFGALLAGAIPVPIYPPTRRSQLEDHVRRHVDILANAQASALTTSREARVVAHMLRARIPTLREVLSIDDLKGPGAFRALRRLPSADSIALLQYTSGSTGSPKGVVLTHRQLLANIRTMRTLMQVSPSDVFVSWLPLYHDMGLIGAWLGSLYLGCLFVVMSPLTFLAHPERWLWAIRGDCRGRCTQEHRQAPPLRR